MLERLAQLCAKLYSKKSKAEDRICMSRAFESLGPAPSPDEVRALIVQFGGQKLLNAEDKRSARAHRRRQKKEEPV